MMTLKQVVEVFNKLVFTDTYGTATFNGQILPFSDSVRSGSTTNRRILETAPTVVIPEKRTVTAGSQVYLVSRSNIDYYLSDALRHKYPVLPVFDTFDIRTAGQILSDSGGTLGVYMSPSQIRREVFEEQSEFTGRYEVTFSSYYSVPAGTILVGGGHYYRVRENSRIDAIGFGVLEATAVYDPVSQVTVETKGAVLNPATDEYTSTTITEVDVFTEHITIDYQHEALGYVKLKEGDRSISYLKSQVSTSKVGDKVGDYLVKAVSDNTDFWTVHGRKV